MFLWVYSYTIYSIFQTVIFKYIILHFFPQLT